MTKYIIEARDENGQLKFDCEQPPVKDFTTEDLAKLCFAKNPNAVLDGRFVTRWVKDNVNPHWYTRIKTW